MTSTRRPHSAFGSFAVPATSCQAVSSSILAAPRYQHALAITPATLVKFYYTWLSIERQSAVLRETEDRMSQPEGGYSTTYSLFDDTVSAQLRREIYGEDIGQNSWLTA